MKRALIGFAVWLALLGLAILVGAILGVRYIRGMFGAHFGAGMLTLVVLPFVFMAWIDLGRALRGDGGKLTYPIGVLIGFPQLLVAFAAMCCGALLLSVHLWAAHIATWWMPPLGAVMCLFGTLWIRDALAKGRTP